ncbi:MAG: CBS domain-containing protein [Candidatus Methanoperedens sp.]|nr:CBS domain-containing protein [Candidatus Methanoperedens sp.]
MTRKERFIKDIMTKNVITIASTLSIREIAKIMAREDVSGVAVENPERGIVGIVAECDVLRHFGKRNWELMTAEEIMTPNVKAIMPETTLEKAADEMQKHNIHRLLVFGRDLSDPAMPVGIISASDIVKQIGRDSI